MLAVIVFCVTVLGCLSQRLDFHPYDKTAEGMFALEDSNSDGHLSLAEVIATFQKYDSNGDGRITRREYSCYQTALHPDLGDFANALFDEYDSDNDHHLDQHDLQAFYAKMDVNADSNITQKEFVDFWIQFARTLNVSVNKLSVMLFTKHENYHIHGHHHHANNHQCH